MYAVVVLLCYLNLANGYLLRKNIVSLSKAYAVPCSESEPLVMRHFISDFIFLLSYWELPMCSVSFVPRMK